MKDKYVIMSVQNPCYPFGLAYPLKVVRESAVVVIVNYLGKEYRVPKKWTIDLK